MCCLKLLSCAAGNRQRQRKYRFRQHLCKYRAGRGIALFVVCVSEACLGVTAAAVIPLVAPSWSSYPPLHPVSWAFSIGIAGSGSGNVCASNKCPAALLVVGMSCVSGGIGSLGSTAPGDCFLASSIGRACRSDSGVMAVMAMGVAALAAASA